jgi:hypothetical protein
MASLTGNNKERASERVVIMAWSLEWAKVINGGGSHDTLKALARAFTAFTRFTRETRP